MILNYSWAVWLAWFLAAFFVLAGLLNLAGPAAARNAMAWWGNPGWPRLVNGACYLVTGLSIAWYPTRPLGLVLSLLLCLSIGITLLRRGDLGRLPPSLILCAATLLTGWGLRLIQPFLD